MKEINLLNKYPKSIRPIDERGKLITDENRKIARKFGKDFFDGDRLFGYGGYYYHSRFWQETVKQFSIYYNLTENSSVLDVGCGKGFMMYDIKQLIPDITIAGLDISQYAYEHSKKEIKEFIKIGNAKELPYADNSFDLVISINTIHNLPLDECKQSLMEIQRVTKKNAFITVDAWRNAKEKKNMEMWNLTALTYMNVEDWKKLFDEVGYEGDYFWFIAK